MSCSFTEGCFVATSAGFIYFCLGSKCNIKVSPLITFFFMTVKIIKWPEERVMFNGGLA